MKKINYDDLTEIEKELGLPLGSMKSIPIYARRPAAHAISKVIEMERNSLFRPGLYYIVLADLKGNTNFNSKYGNAHADLRVQWFQTAAIQAIGEIDLSNYATFNKTIGDASLLIFSSINDVIRWSTQLNIILEGFNQEYESVVNGGDPNLPEVEDELKDDQIEDFKLNVRRLIHLGEVRYVNENDPLSLAVSQIFKIEKDFSETKLGCTEIVANTIRPAIQELGFSLVENKNIRIIGEERDSMSYYITPKN